jgi:hypothetical protein
VTQLKELNVKLGKPRFIACEAEAITENLAAGTVFAVCFGDE